MNRETISDKQGICLILLFISGETLARQTASRAGQDLWLAIIIAIVFAIPMVLMYARLLSLFSGKDLFDIFELLFGKYFGKTMSGLFFFYALYTGSWVLRNVSEASITTTVPETPKVIFMLFYIFLSIWVVKEGIEVLGRWASLFVILNSPLPSILILLLIPEMDINNIRPVLFNGIKPVMEGALQAFTFPFAETMVFTMILCSLKTRKSPYGIYVKGLLLGGMLILGVSLAEVLVLGPDIYTSTYFPNQNVATKVDLGDFLQRMEVVVMVAIVTSAFLKISIYLLAATRGIAKIFNLKDYRFIVTPVGALMVTLAIFGPAEDNIMEVFRVMDEVWIYSALPLQIFIPASVFIFAEIKMKRIKDGNV